MLFNQSVLVFNYQADMTSFSALFFCALGLVVFLWIRVRFRVSII